MSTPTVRPYMSIGAKLKVHVAILEGKSIEFQSFYSDGRWVPVNGGLYDDLHGTINTSWQDGMYRVKVDA